MVEGRDERGDNNGAGEDRGKRQRSKRAATAQGRPNAQDDWVPHPTTAHGVDCRWSVTNRNDNEDDSPSIHACHCERLLAGQKAGTNGWPEGKVTSKGRKTAG